MVASDVRVYALCACVMYIKFLATTMIQGRKAFSAGTRAPEDNSLPMAKGQPSQGFRQAEAPTVDHQVRQAMDEETRWKRVIQNDLESIPIAFVVFWAAIAVGASQALSCVLMIVYTAARVTHTIVFVAQKPRALPLVDLGRALHHRLGRVDRGHRPCRLSNSNVKRTSNVQNALAC